MHGWRGWLLAWGAALPWALFRAGTLAESDTFWQIRTGQLTLREHRIPATDPFSWTDHGAPWTQNSWAFNVALALAHDVGGLPGVALLSVALSMAVVGLMLLLARDLGAEPLPATVVVLLTMPLLTPYLSARPQVVDYLGVLAVVLLVRRLASGRGHPVPICLALGLGCAVWVNLHAAAPLGVAIVVGSGLVLLLGPSRRAGAWCLVGGALAAGGVLLNPRGLGIVAQAVGVRGASADIVEWRPPDPSDPLQLLVLALGLLAAAVAVRSRERVVAVALTITLVGSVSAMRFLPVVLVLAVPVLVSRPQFSRYAESRRTMFRRVGALTALGCAVLAALSLPHLGRPDPAYYSAEVARAIPQGCRVYNDYLVGGYLILVRPTCAQVVESKFDGLQKGDIVMGHFAVAKARGCAWQRAVKNRSESRCRFRPRWAFWA